MVDLAVQSAERLKGLSDSKLVEQLTEAALTMGSYYEWAQYQLADRERYIAAATLTEDCMDELDRRLADACPVSA